MREMALRCIDLAVEALFDSDHGCDASTINDRLLKEAACEEEAAEHRRGRERAAMQMDGEAVEALFGDF